MTVFVARQLTHDPLEADADEFLSLERIPLDRVMRLAANGEMPDAKSLAALFLARARLEGPS
jgi:ADP-ribose pyrophosphatase